MRFQRFYMCFQLIIPVFQYCCFTTCVVLHLKCIVLHVFKWRCLTKGSLLNTFLALSNTWRMLTHLYVRLPKLTDVMFLYIIFFVGFTLLQLDW